MYQQLLAEAERLTDRSVIEIEMVQKDSCHVCRQRKHWKIALPSGVMWWQRDEDGEPSPLRLMFCVERAAAGWLAGFLAEWNDIEGGVDADALTRAETLRKSRLPEVAGGYTTGRSNYRYGRWNRYPIGVDNASPGGLG